MRLRVRMGLRRRVVGVGMPRTASRRPSSDTGSGPATEAPPGPANGMANGPSTGPSNGATTGSGARSASAERQRERSTGPGLGSGRPLLCGGERTSAAPARLRLGRGTGGGDGREGAGRCGSARGLDGDTLRRHGGAERGPSLRALGSGHHGPLGGPPAPTPGRLDDGSTGRA